MSNQKFASIWDALEDTSAEALGCFAAWLHPFQVEHHAATDNRSEEIGARRGAGRDVVID